MNKKILITNTIVLLTLITACTSTTTLYIYSNEDKITTKKTSITLKTHSKGNAIKGDIKIRGGSSIRFPKKSYAIAYFENI